MDGDVLMVIKYVEVIFSKRTLYVVLGHAFIKKDATNMTVVASFFDGNC
jgi:hypothetical protein